MSDRERGAAVPGRDGRSPTNRGTFAAANFNGSDSGDSNEFQLMLHRAFTIATLGLLLFAATAQAQVLLVPTERTPFRLRFELNAQDAQYLLLPQGPAQYGEGPFRFRFEDDRLQALLESPPATAYLSARDAGFHLQVLNLRPRGVDEALLGPKRFVIENAARETVGQGVLLVQGRLPEALDLLTDEGTRTLEWNRPATVRLALRTHGNYAGRGVQVLNPRDFELRVVEEELDASGVLAITGELRPLRLEANELRLAVESADGRVAELAFPGLTVRAPAPRRVRVLGGPLYLDPTGRGEARIEVRDLPRALVPAPEIITEGSAEIGVLEQRFDAERGILFALVEFIPRTSRAGGAREIRDLTLRSGAQSFRGFLEVVGAPQVSGARTEPHTRAVLTAGGGPAVLRVQGQNLDAMALDCAPLGAICRTLSSSATELVAEVSVAAAAREGEHLLVLRGAQDRAAAETSVRVQVEHPAIPIPLTGAEFLRLECRSCRAVGDAITLRPAEAAGLRLQLDDARLPAEHGWQRLVITVTRVRGESRQVIRTFGSAAAPRSVRHGAPGGMVTLLDATADPRHGDHFLIHVSHVAEQYPPEQRTSMATADAWIGRIYIDAGAAKRLTADVAVQPVLLGPGDDGMDVLYPNAGLGVTWQPLNERLEPRLVSVKLQFLATNLSPSREGVTMGQPALFLSGNLRIPGSDPGRPLGISAGVARMFGDDARWRMLAGASMDLGLARMIFGP
jgi:hypothetical protein